MLYVITKQDYDAIEFVQALEGSAGIDVREQHARFCEPFTEVGLGRIVYPRYDGPLNPGDADPNKPNYGLLSGFIYDPAAAKKSPPNPQLIAWRVECDRIRQAWYDRRNAAEAACRAKYPGDDVLRMFLSYLQQEHGLRPVEDVTWANL